MKYRSLRYKQLGHANMFQELMARLKGGKSTNQNVEDPKNKKIADPNDPANKGKDPNDPNSQITKNPLDNFKGLFTLDPNKQKDGTPPSFSLDQEVLKKITGNLSFSGDITPELAEKLKSGDAETIKGLLNSVGQNAYMTLMQHLPALTEQFVNARLEHSQKGLGKSVKTALTQQSLAKLAADNPVLKKQLEVVSAQLLENFPDADPEWVAEQTGTYFLEVTRLLFPDAVKDTSGNLQDNDNKKPDPADISQRPGFDWGTYLVNQATSTPANKKT